MKYYITWKEKGTVINECTGWIEADSEEEAKKKLEENGIDEYDDCYEIDSYDNEVIKIEEIEECYDD